MAKRILYVQYTNPAYYPSLEHSSRLLARRGWRVMFLATGSHGSDSLVFPPHPSISVLKWRHCRKGVLQKIHYAAFCLWTTLMALAWRPGWIYASDLFSCPTAAVLAILGFRVIYHEHDSPVKGDGASLSRFTLFLLTFRRIAASKAEACVIPNGKRAEIFRREMGGRASVHCVWNCPSLEEVPPAVSRSPGPGRILYHGSIVPSRLPLTAIEALAGLSRPLTLRIVGYTTVSFPDYLDRILETADKLGIRDRIEIVGEVATRMVLLKLAGECDIGLALMPRTSGDINEQHMEGASNKPFEYLACGLALLVSELPDWKRIYVDAGYGLACEMGDARSIAAKLEWFLTHPGETASCGERGRRRILEEWNYEKQFEPVASLMGAGAPAEAIKTP